MTNVLGMNGCFKNRMMREFLGGTMVRTLYFYCRGIGSISGQGTKIPQTTWHDQKNSGENSILME